MITHRDYTSPENCPLVQQVNLGDGVLDPEHLWVGLYAHLTRDEVIQLQDYLTKWLETGKLY